MRTATGLAATAVLAALVTAGCTSGVLAGEGSHAAPVTQAAARATPTPATPSPAVDDRRNLIDRARLYITTVQDAEWSDDDHTLSRDVCPATFTELEFAAKQPEMYQAQPALAAFLDSVASVAWTCELRQTADMRDAVRGLVAPGQSTAEAPN